MRLFIWIILIFTTSPAFAGEAITVLEVEERQGEITAQFTLTGTTLTRDTEGQAQITSVDRLQANLVVKSPESHKVELPTFSGATFGDFTLIEQGKTTRQRTTGIISTTSWLVEPYNKGEYNLPTLLITSKESNNTEGHLTLPLPTLKIIAPEPTEESFDILPSRPTPTSTPWPITCAVIAGIGVIAGGIVLLKGKKRLCTPSPKQRAVAKLATLHEHAEEKTKALSLITRQFLDGNFNLCTVEKTYREYEPFLIKHPHIQNTETILAILKQCDRINYSGATITDEQLTALIQQTRTFIEECQEPLRPDEATDTCGRW